jgi:predicted transcriptional regulator
MSEDNNFVAMTIEVVASYVAHNVIAPDDVPSFIAKTHAAIRDMAKAPEPDVPAAPSEAYEPAVTVRKSTASREHILSLIDGKPYKTLKRHLAGHGLTPAQYRERYNLKADYPMVAPAYSDHRREVARSLGLGRKVTGARAASSPPAPAIEADAPPVVPPTARAATKPVAAKAAPKPRSGAKGKTTAKPEPEAKRA